MEAEFVARVLLAYSPILAGVGLIVLSCVFHLMEQSRKRP